MSDKLEKVENSDMDQIMLPNHYSPHVSTDSEEHNDFMPKKNLKLDSEEVAGSSCIPDTQTAIRKSKSSYVDSREDRNFTLSKKGN